MSIVELFLIALGLSMDAFAVAICKGLSLNKVNLKSAVIVGLYFGIFQGGMPLIGYFTGINFKDYISSIDHWIAFILLALIGINMLKEARDNTCDIETEDSSNNPLCFKNMSIMAVATSIDALAVGVSFAFLDVNIITAVVLIGITTFTLSAFGVFMGVRLGSKFQSKAETFGGIVLILIGLKILLEHLNFI